LSVKGDIKSDASIVPERSSKYDFFAHADAFSEDDILTKNEEFRNSYSDHGSVEAYANRPQKSSPMCKFFSRHKIPRQIRGYYLNIGEILRAVDKHLFPPTSYCKQL
jgi:hypothetical protein